MKSYPLILTLLAAALMGGCKTVEEAYTPPEMVPPGSFVSNWAASIGFEKVNAFYFVDDMLFVYGPRNMVAAFDPAGSLKFRMQIGLPGDRISPPMVQPERVIFATGSVLEVVTRDGIRLKTIELSRPVRSSGLAVGDMVYVGVDSATGGRIAAISLAKPYGDPAVWTRMARGAVRTQPQLFENVIYFANENGEVISITNDPTLLWPRSDEMPDSIFKTDGKIAAAIRVDLGGVYVPSTDSKLYALDPTTGKIRWEYFAGTPLDQSAVPTADTVYIYVNGQGLTAIDKQQTPRYPQARWVNANARKVLADDSQYVYVLLESGHIAALDKKTGEQKFQTERGDFVASATHVNPDDRTIFAITSDMQLMSIRPVTRAGVVGKLVMAPVTPEAIH